MRMEEALTELLCVTSSLSTTCIGEGAEEELDDELEEEELEDMICVGGE